jgi:parvulin-like peptidyl-prolyl isomerase
MGTLSKMRTVSPYILVTIAVLFIAFMVISDMDVPTLMSRGTNPATAVVGSVNGEKIMYAEFERRVRDQVEVLRNQQKSQNQNDQEQDIDEAPIREQVWNEMTEEILLRQESKKLGISVSNEEILDILLQEPPQFLRQQFTDSTGKFNYQTYLELVTNPDLIAQKISPQVAADFKKMLVNIEDYIRREKLQMNVRAALGAAYSVSDMMFLERRYKAENTVSSVAYIALVANPPANDKERADADKLYPVKDEEIAAYYNTYQAIFKQKPSRKMKYVLFPMVPSSSDSQKVQKRMERLMAELNAAQTAGARDTVFERYATEYGGQVSDFKHVQDVPPQTMAMIAPMQVRDVVGPIQRPEGGVSFLRLDGKRSGENIAVKASHILIGLGNPKNVDSAKARAAEILKEVNAPNADFAELAKKYSQDPGSAQRGGELGFFSKGMMVKPFEEAAFGAAVGSVVGPVETQFGFHIIKVNEKKTDEVKYTEITLNPVLSTGTRNAVRRQAQMFREQVSNGVLFDTAAKRMNLVSQESGFFRRSVAAFGSRTLTNFAFENDMGAVSEPIEVRGGGLVVAQVTESRIAGIKPLADVKEDIKLKLQQSKRLDALKAKADEIYKKVAALDSLSKARALDSTLTVFSMTEMRDNGSVQGVGSDYVFTSVVPTLPVGKITGPIRGDRAYYIAQVKSRQEADMKNFATSLPNILKNEQNKAQATAFARWKNDIRDRATIEDFRSNFFRD